MNKENLPQNISWDYYPEREGNFQFECFQCKEKNHLKSHLFLVESSNTEEGTTFTSQYKKIDGWITRKLGPAIAILIALLIGTIIANVLGSPPILYAIFAVILFIPLKPIFSFLFSRIDPGKKIPIWKFKCKNCGLDMFIASDGISALLGKGS